MEQYMVYIGRETHSRDQRTGRHELQWYPFGVYKADKPERACQAAAADSGEVATFFAVAGFPWGIDMARVDGVERLARSQSLDDTIANAQRLLDQIAGKE